MCRWLVVAASLCCCFCTQIMSLSSDIMSQMWAHFSQKKLDNKQDGAQTACHNFFR
jgi:hypothetical protein